MIARIKTKIMQQLHERKTLVGTIDMRDPWIILATWFGSSLIGIGAGTWGTLAAIPFAASILFFGGPYALILFIIAISALGWKASAEFEKKTGQHDCSLIVIDEVAGYSIALLAAPQPLNILWIFIAFVVFRIIDTLKPWPISILDTKIDGATGVMLDDIAAGAVSALIIWGLSYA